MAHEYVKDRIDTSRSGSIPMERTLVGIPPTILHDWLTPIKLKDGANREGRELAVILGLPSHPGPP